MKNITQLVVLSLFVGNTIPAQAAPNDNLGRLFSRPSERNNLDVLRQNQQLKVIVPQENLEPEMLDKSLPAEPVSYTHLDVYKRQRLSLRLAHRLVAIL